MEEINKEELERDKELKDQQEEVQKEFKGFFESLKEYLPKLLTIRVGTDKEATAERIREGISIKGHTAWILVFSILIASIGLNVSSTAVVIGAMLISPLMGPILGIGYSIAVNDVDTLKGSVINFGAMVALSVLTSFLFFSIPIFKEATPELLARTKPDVRDVLIAISGGLALIIAISRPKPQFNTVFVYHQLYLHRAGCFRDHEVFEISDAQIHQSRQEKENFEYSLGGGSGDPGVQHLSVLPPL